MGRRLAVVAGAGILAPQVVGAALADGDTLCVFALTPQVMPPGVEQQAASIQHLTALFDAIRRFGASHLVLAGSVTLTDADRLRLLEVVGGDGRRTGDAYLSHLAVGLERLCGAILIGPHEVSPGLLAPAGAIAGPAARADQLATAALAMWAARRVGEMDLGQAAVAAGGRIVAVEDFAGTDELLTRVQNYRSRGLIECARETPVVLAKACKPQQPLFVDLPAIGPSTVSGAAGAGISLIAVEAGRSLLLDREQLINVANELGITIIGLPVDA